MKIVKMFYPENYSEIKKGHILMDASFGSRWRAIEKTENNVVLQNLSGGDRGVKVNANPKTCRMVFALMK